MKSHKVYGDSDGPLGIPMRSDSAKEVEQLISALPAECKELIEDGPMRLSKAADAVDIVEDERADISFITTESVDRDREVVMAGGLDFRTFSKNPVVTWAHDYASLPVGRSMWLKKGEQKGMRGWLAKTQYIGKPDGWVGDWFNDAVWHYVKSGALPGKSIGFIPLEVRSPTEKEIVARPELASVRRVITKAHVLEYAVTPVQSNPDAVVQATAQGKSAGIVFPMSLLDSLGLVLPAEPFDLKEFVEDDDDGGNHNDPPPVVKTATVSDMKAAIVAAMKGTLEQSVASAIDRLRGKV